MKTDNNSDYNARVHKVKQETKIKEQNSFGIYKVALQQILGTVSAD